MRGDLEAQHLFLGEALPEKVLNEPTYHSLACDLFLVIGSTLVSPSEMVETPRLEAKGNLI